jgi:hypothetical protein
MRVGVSEQNSAVENSRLLLSRRSAARALDISVRMIDYAIAAGLIESRRINSRILILSESLARFAASDQVVPRAPAHCQECA